jgi:hypothetical protein
MSINKEKIQLSQKQMSRYAYKILSYPQPENISIYTYTAKALEKSGFLKDVNISDKNFVLNNWINIGGKLKQKKKLIKKEYKSLKIPKEFVQTKDFLNSYGWKKLRMEAIIKYGRKCACCGATPESGAIMNVDHIKPRKTHPHLALDINNLQILCSDCNHGKGNWDSTDWR